MSQDGELKQTRFGARAHALYVVLIAFGIERLVEGAYSIWLSPPNSLALKHPANVVVLLGVISWGARLFWSATNIERYAARADIPAATRTTRVVGVHFPLLLGQSAVFFWVCESYRTTVVPLLAGQQPTAGSAELFAVLVVASLIYNAAWLAALVWPVAPQGCPEIVWIGNNFLFAALIGLAALVLPSIPPPDVSYSVLIYGGLLIANSIVDFRKTGKIYFES